MGKGVFKRCRKLSLLLYHLQRKTRRSPRKITSATIKKLPSPAKMILLSIVSRWDLIYVND